MNPKPVIETCFSTALYPLYHNDANRVVVIDVLRATTSICAAFENGIKDIIPVAGIKEALSLKEKTGFIIAAERDGIKLPEADMGNSPTCFSKDVVGGNSIIYSTTNGTKAIHMAAASKEVLIGSLINLEAISEYLAESTDNLLLFCSGWKQKFNLEDALFAGALAEALLEKGDYTTICDSTLAAIDLWKSAKTHLLDYGRKLSWNGRLNMPEVYEYCFTPNQTRYIPYFNGERILAKKM